MRTLIGFHWYLIGHIQDAGVSERVVVVSSSVPVHMHTPHGVLSQVEQLMRLAV